MLLSCEGIISLRPRFGKEKNGRILIDRFVGFAESAIQVEDDEPFAAAFFSSASTDERGCPERTSPSSFFQRSIVVGFGEAVVAARRGTQDSFFRS